MRIEPITPGDRRAMRAPTKQNKEDFMRTVVVAAMLLLVAATLPADAASERVAKKRPWGAIAFNSRTEFWATPWIRAQGAPPKPRHRAGAARTAT